MRGRKQMKTIKVNGIKLKVNAEGKVEGYQLPYQPTLQRFKGCNGKNTFDLNTLEARSYGHWCFAKKIKGQWVFNDYRYSVTTGGHQSTMNAMFSQLGIKIALYVDMHA